MKIDEIINQLIEESKYYINRNILSNILNSENIIINDDIKEK